MSARDRLLFAVLLLDGAMLAVLEALFLPLRFDGFLLPDLGGFPLPLSAVLAAVTMPWLASTAARLSDRAMVGVGPLLVWLGCLSVFALIGPGGDLVVPADWRTLLLLACGTFPTALVLGGRIQPPPAVPVSRAGQRPVGETGRRG